MDNYYPKFRYSLIVNCVETENRKPSVPIALLARGKGEKKGSKYDENVMLICDSAFFSFRLTIF